MRVTPTGCSLCLLAAMALPSLRGQSRLQRVFEQSITQLEDPAQRLDALRQLENLGTFVVPELKKRLQWQQRSKLSRQVQADLLYVLGRTGEAGLATLPELRQWLGSGDGEVFLQLLSTLSRLAPFMPKATSEAVARDLRRHPLARYAESELRWSLALGSEPELSKLRGYLRNRVDLCAAACRWIEAKGKSRPEQREDLVAAIETRLQKMTIRKRVAFRRGADAVEGALANAWLTISNQPPNQMVARAMLSCRQPTDRLRGVLWLQDHGSSLPAEERADVVVRLWDGDASVASAAARCLARWQIKGAVGLPALHLMATKHEQQAVRVACKEAATRIAASFAGLTPGNAAWLDSANRALLAQPAAPGLPPAGIDKAGRAVFHELLMMACWNRPERLRALLGVARRGRPDEDMVGAVYGWLRQHDAEVVDPALSWLARHRQHVAAAMTARDCDDHHSEAYSLAAHWVPQESRGAAHEAMAWFETTNSTTADLREHIEGQNSRLQARALAELLTRDADQFERLLPRLHELTNLSNRQAMQTRMHTDQRWQNQPFWLAKPVRVLAAMAIAHAGRTVADRNGLEQLVIDHCHVTLDELPAMVRRQRQSGKLLDTIESLEATCRKALYVADDLRWPRAGAR